MPSFILIWVIMIWVYGFGMVGCWPVYSIVYFRFLFVGLGRRLYLLFVVIDSVSFFHCLCVSFFHCLCVNFQLWCAHFSDRVNIVYCFVRIIWWFIFNHVIGNVFPLLSYLCVASSALTVFYRYVIHVFTSVMLCSVLYSMFCRFSMFSATPVIIWSASIFPISWFLL